MNVTEGQHDEPINHSLLCVGLSGSELVEAGPNDGQLRVRLVCFCEQQCQPQAFFMTVEQALEVADGLREAGAAVAKEQRRREMNFNHEVDDTGGSL
jgi:hypothetical protein